MGDGQLTCLHPGGRQLRRNRQHCIPFAGDDHTFRAVDSRDRDHLTVGFNCLADAFLTGGQSNHRPCLRQGTHQATTRRHELQPILQAEDTSYTSRRQLANTVPNQQIRLDPPRLPDRGQGHFKGKERRLGKLRLVNQRPLGRPCLLSPVSYLVSRISYLWIEHGQKRRR